MTFCREFGMTPLEYAEQPADVILRWNRYLRLEGDEAARRDTLAKIRAGRRH